MQIDIDGANLSLRYPMEYSMIGDTPAEWVTADAVCQRIVPQPADHPPVPLVALLDAKLLANEGDGFREGGTPCMRKAWQQGLAALETESAARHGGRAFPRWTGPRRMHCWA